MVLSRSGGVYRVYTGAATVAATLPGRLKRASHGRVLVGDRVTVRIAPDGSAPIETVHERRSLLQRRSPGKVRGVRPVAANVEQVVVVGAVRAPDWDPTLIDRFTAVAEANGLPVVVVVNKCDLAGDEIDLGEPYRIAGYAVLHTSVPEASGLVELRACLGDRISLFAGSTGVGKSSLLNALVPGLRLRTAAVSRRARVGRHTTVSAEMHPLGAGGFVVDTPGLRDIGLWGLEPREVAAAFPEFASWASRCRFDNCRHVAEPGCAVTEAAQRGTLAESRLRSYRRFLAEAERAARPWTG